MSKYIYSTNNCGGGGSRKDSSTYVDSPSWILKLNGHDRFSEREGRYFNLVQPYQHHTNVPCTGINLYSFALDPESHQPSGTCNFSRIDHATLHMTTTANTTSGTAKVRIYATNYNIFRIMSGMGGLAYSS